MTDSPRKTLLAALGIIVLGLVIGVANNLLAGDARRLDWVGTYPPKGEPGCKKYEAELAAKAAGSSGLTAPVAETAPAPVETAPAPVAETAPAPAPVGE